MAYDSVPTKKVKLPSDEQYWVQIKTSIPYGELKRYDEYGGDGGPFTPGDRLKLIIVDWNLDDEDGNKLEVKPENIDLLREIDWLTIIEAYNAAGESEDKKKDLVKPSSPTTVDQK